MSSDSAKTVFLNALEIASSEARRAYLRAQCGNDQSLRAEVEELLRHHDQIAAFGESASVSSTTPPPRLEHPGTRIGAVQAAAADRRRAAWAWSIMAEQTRAGPPQGGAEDHQAGHGHAAGDRPLRGRAAGAGADGPPEHRQGARRRRDRRRAGPYFVMELVQGVPITRVLRREPADAAAAAGAVRAGLPGGAARASEGDHPPRPQAVERPGRRCTTAGRCRR